MANINDLITYQDLSTFSNKCKEIFKTNPGVLELTTIRNKIAFTVDPLITYNSNDCKSIFINIMGETNDATSKYICFYGNFTFNNSLIISGSGLNLNKEAVVEELVAYDDNNNLYFGFKSSSDLKNVIINVTVANKYDKVSYEKAVILNKNYNPGSNYCYLSTNTLDTSKLGLIEILGLIPLFKIKVGVNSSTLQPIYLIYPLNTTFDTIYESVQTLKFKNNISMLYDFTLKFASGDNPVNIGDFSSSLIKLPIPDLLNNFGNSNWYQRVLVQNGLIINADNNVSIPKATSTTLGGIKLGSTASSGNYYYVLTQNDVAYIDLSNLPIDVHRYSTLPTPNLYKNQVFLYIGTNVPGTFYNGYYYKSIIVNRILHINQACSEYANVNQLAGKLEFLHINNYDLFEDFSGEIKIDLANSSVLQLGDDLRLKGKFKITYISNGLSKVVINNWSYLDLQEYLNLKLNYFFYNPSNSYELIVQLTDGDYKWMLWDVQPRDIDKITNTEIDTICI